MTVKMYGKQPTAATNGQSQLVVLGSAADDIDKLVAAQLVQSVSLRTLAKWAQTYHGYLFWSNVRGTAEEGRAVGRSL